MHKTFALVSTSFLAFTLAVGTAQAADLRIALADDPDALDPVTNATQTGATVLNTMCARLLTTDTELTVHPYLAESWEWSEDALTLTLHLVEGATFHDGTVFDAEAAKINIERALTLPGSQRASDISTIETIEAVDDHTLVINLSQPSAQLLSKLADRVGMMFSPAKIEELGANLGREPSCVGPYAFVERSAQDRIVLEKDPDYIWSDQYAFDRVIFMIIPDDTVRLANLQSGGVDMIEKLDPSMAELVMADPSLATLQSYAPNNQALMLNLEREGPMQDPLVREAFELSLDRQAIVDVAFAGQYLAANQFVDPESPFYNGDYPLPPRDPARAVELLAEAGYTDPVPFTILTPNRPLAVRVGEMMQAMSIEGGFDTRLEIVDFATTLNLTNEGNFEAWGPIGPQFANDVDTLVAPVLASDGGRNVGKYDSAVMDDLIAQSRAATDPEERLAVFHQIAATAVEDRPVIYLYHQVPMFVMDARLEGVFLTGDGFLQLAGATME